jgi:hypothetical protein
MKIRAYVTAIAFLGMILVAVDSHPLSPIAKSSQDYGLTLSTLRNVNIMVENFGDEQMKK